jgi:hypothetical protein
MSISISEMRDFADDALGGTTINLTDIGDDMGASLLSNIRPARDEPTRSVSFNMESSSRSENNGFGGIQIMEPLDAVPLDIPLSGSDPLAPSSQPQISVNRDSGWGSSFNDAPPSTNEIHLASSARDPEAERKEKSDLINKLNRLESKGFTISRKYTMDNNLEEIKQEFERLTDARGLETGIKFQRQIMMGLVTGLEMLNEKVNPFDVQLKGWSESVHENLDDFDEVFEEIYDKYKGNGKSVPPEARLMFMLAGSGFMFHMSNSFYRKQMPGIDEIFRQNPGLQRQFSAAAAQAAGPGFGNFMGMAMGPGGGPGAGPQQGPAQAYAPPPMAPTGMFYNNSVPNQQQMPPQAPQQFMAQEPPRVARREMKGPSGVDDILKTFEEVRRAESEPMFNPFPETQQQQQQPAFAAAAEMQSVMTGGDDVASMTDGAGRRRRRKAQPIGNTLVLDA